MTVYILSDLQIRYEIFGYKGILRDYAYYIGKSLGYELGHTNSIQKDVALAQLNKLKFICDTISFLTKPIVCMTLSALITAAGSIIAGVSSPVLATALCALAVFSALGLLTLVGKSIDNDYSSSHKYNNDMYNNFSNFYKEQSEEIFKKITEINSSLETNVVHVMPDKSNTSY